MCHQYRYKKSVEAAIEQFGIDFVDFRWEELLADFFPGKTVPVVRGSAHHERELVGLHWGLVPRWWSPDKHQQTLSWFRKSTYNARCETIHEKSSYRKPFQSQRCLLLATEFFDYGRWFFRKSEQPVAIAGIWERWQREDEQIESCSMVTTVANAQVAEVHPKERMPVFLDSEESIRRWMSPDISTREPLEEFFLPYPDEKMSYRIAEEQSTTNNQANAKQQSLF